MVGVPAAATIDITNPNDAQPGLAVFYFGSGEDTLRPDARSALRDHAAYLKTNTDASVWLEGPTDEIEAESRAASMSLGEDRASTARDFLVLQGVDASRIETVSYGEERPAVMGSYEGAWEQNRRVEIVYQ